MKLIALLAACFLTSTAWAAENPQRPRLIDIFSAAGDFSVPAAWSGIWDFNNIDYDCTTEEKVGSDADTDTLCTGENLYPGKLNCTGSITDTTVDVDCSGTEEVKPGCSVTFTYSLNATRSGDSMTSTSTYGWEYSPSLCFFGLPDQCIETQSTATRVGPEPPDCLTSVDEMSWGRVKATYR